MRNDLPFAVIPFQNESGTTSFRVSGSWNGERIRKNFGERALADAFCNAKNAEAFRAVPLAPTAIVQTTAKPADVRILEDATRRIGNRWELSAVIDAGIAALEARPASNALLSELATKWLALVRDEVSDRWYSDLKHRVGAFVAAHPNLTNSGLNRVTVREWLDSLPHAQQSKANMRNALHRFGGWLVERGFQQENPASEIRITRRTSGATLDDKALPTVFNPRQCEALLRACELGACRRLLGWMAACLFTGMRPDSEAPRAEWPEVNLKTGEWSVLKRKRGGGVRIVQLTATASAWMRIVKADKLEKPALYSRRSKERAIELANDWLADNYPAEPSIKWENDITRHTFASYRSAQIPVHKLAEEMGSSPGTIYGHYRHPRPKAEVKAFWAILPAR